MGLDDLIEADSAVCRLLVEANFNVEDYAYRCKQIKFLIAQQRSERSNFTSLLNDG